MFKVFLAAIAFFVLCMVVNDFVHYVRYYDNVPNDVYLAVYGEKDSSNAYERFIMMRAAELRCNGILLEDFSCKVRKE